MKSRQQQSTGTVTTHKNGFIGDDNDHHHHQIVERRTTTAAPQVDAEAIENGDDESLGLLSKKRTGSSHNNNNNGDDETRGQFIQKVIQTVSYYAVFLCFGIAVSLLGPTLKDLARTSHSSEQDMGWLFTCKGLGGMLGSLFGGKMYDLFSNSCSARAAHYFLAFHVFVMGGAMIVMPLIPNLYVLMVVFTVFGASIAFLTMGTNILCMWTWRDKVAPIILGMSCIAGVGNFVGPAIVATEIDVRYVYWIGGIVSIVGGVLTILGQIGSYCVQLPPQQPQQQQQQKKADDADNDDYSSVMVVGDGSGAGLSNTINSTSGEQQQQASKIADADADEQFSLYNNDWRQNCRNVYRKSRDFRLAFVVGFCLFGSVIFEACFGGLLYSFVAEKNFARTKKENSLMTSVFWISVMAGRLFGALLSSIGIKPFMILISNVVLCHLSVFIFLLISNIALPHPFILWMAIVIMGLGLSGLFPTTFSFPTTSMNNIHVSGAMSSVMILLAASAEMTTPLLVTHIFGLMNLFWVLLMGCFVLTLGYAILFLWALSIQIELKE